MKRFGMEAVVAAGGLLLVAGVAAMPAARAVPQDGGEAKEEADAGVRKTRKARRLLEASGWLEATKAEMLAGVRAKEEAGTMPAGSAAKFEEVADWNGLLDLAVASYVKNLDEDVMDAGIVFYESPEGKKFAEAQPELAKAGAAATGEFVVDTSRKVVEAVAGMGLGEKARGLLDRFKKHDAGSNETAAIATLRNLVSAQAQIQTSGKIDCDDDGIGEYTGFLELTGAAAVRTSADGKERGTRLSPAILSPLLSGVDARGVVRKSGYCFRIFLPDDAGPAAGFVHETGPAESAGLAGGTGRIQVNLSETTWCAYAWPEEKGKTGDRAFFVNQAGDVIQSSNDSKNWSGPADGPPGNSAFTGNGITARLAIGTAGRDGGVWKVTY